MTIPKRLPDWHQRLQDYLHLRAKIPWAWGTHDCLIFAVGAVEAMTDADIQSRYGEQRDYCSEDSAYSTLKLYGSMEKLMADIFSAPGIDSKYARRGDLLLFPFERFSQVGVCLGRHTAIASRPGGYVLRESSEATSAWRVY